MPRLPGRLLKTTDLALRGTVAGQTDGKLCSVCLQFGDTEEIGYQGMRWGQIEADALHRASPSAGPTPLRPT